MASLWPPQRQSHDTEEKIKEEFEKLRRYLNMEEATRLAALKQEEGEKISFIQMIVDLSRDTFFLSDTVSDMEELVKDSSFLMVTTNLKEGRAYSEPWNDLSFLLSPQNFKSSLERFVSLHHFLLLNKWPNSPGCRMWWHLVVRISLQELLLSFISPVLVFPVN